MKDTTKDVNRELFRKRYELVGDYGSPVPVFYSPNITNSGLCMYGQTPDFILPDYKFQAERNNRLQIANPYTPLPGVGYYPPTCGTRKVVDYFDNDVQANQVLQTIRHPQLRYVTEKRHRRPKGVFTKHGFRKYRTEKQVDPDLEEMYKMAMNFVY